MPSTMSAVPTSTQLTLSMPSTTRARAIDAPRMARKLSLYAGQGAGRIHDVLPAADRMAELIRGLPAGTAG